MGRGIEKVQFKSERVDGQKGSEKDGDISRIIGKAEPTGMKQLLFFFNDTAANEIYTLSLHDALPI